MLNKDWFPDMVVGHAARHNCFPSDLIPCTSTLHYWWIDRGIFKTKNINSHEMVSRKPRNDSPTHRESRRVFAPSIED